MLFSKTKYNSYYCEIEKLDVEVVIDTFLFVKVYKKSKFNSLKEFGPFPTLEDAFKFCNTIKLFDFA